MTDNLALNISLYLIINLLVFLSFFLFSRRWLGLTNLESTLSSFVFMNAQIILVFFALGIFWSGINAANTYLTHLFISILLIYYVLHKYPLKGFNLKIANSYNYIKNFALNCFPYNLITLIVLLQLINLLLNIIIYFPISWDDYHYHLGFVNDIIQTSRLRDYLYTHVYTITFPHNIELVNLWHSIFLRSDFFVEITNFFFLLAGCVAVSLTAQILGVRKSFSYLSALAVFFIPMNIILVKTTKVDLAIACLLVICLYFLLKYLINKQKGSHFLLISALSVGIIFGAKSSAIVYVSAVLLFFITMVAISNKFNLTDIKNKSYKYFLFIFISCVLFGSYWYIRSWVWYGNPLYPLEIDRFGIYFPGTWRNLDFADGLPQIASLSLLERFHYVWTEKESWFGVYNIPDSKLNGLGSLWYILLLPSYLIMLVYSAVNKNIQILLYLLIYLVLLLVIPGSWVPHYSVIITFGGAIAFGLTLEKLINSKLIGKFIIVLFTFLALINAILISNLAIFNLSDYNERIQSIINDESYGRTYQFQESNKYLNKHLDNGDVVIVALGTYFPYALVKEGFNSSTITIDYQSEESWLEEVGKINPRYIMVQAGSRELLTIQKNMDLFKEVVVEPVGPHYLYHYRLNTKNNDK